MNTMKELRIKLISDKNLTLAYEVVRFFDSPTELLYEKLCSSIGPIEGNTYLSNELRRCLLMYESNRQKYNEEILFAQKVIWDEIISCADFVIRKTELVKSISAFLHRDNYKKAMEQVYLCCNIISELQARISKLEDILGIDRYLDTVCEEDIKVIVQFLDEATTYLDVLSGDYKNYISREVESINIKESFYINWVRYNMVIIKYVHLCRLIRRKYLYSLWMG